MARNFMDLLGAKWAEGKFVCVGLDSEERKLPENESQYTFNMEIIEATKDIAACYKPNLAFYAGSERKENLLKTIEYGRAYAPSVPWILDVKLGDIGNTNLGYVEEVFHYFGADACTVHNYMGVEAMRPFLDKMNKGIFVLCKTSNQGSGEFQNLDVNVTSGMIDELEGYEIDPLDPSSRTRIALPFYQWVARRISSPYGWNYNGNCGLVVGATYPEELEAVRSIADSVPILCPGVGKQGGDLQKAVRAARNSENTGFLINSSSGIIFASKGKDFAEAARREALKLDESIIRERAKK